MTAVVYVIAAIVIAVLLVILVLVLLFQRRRQRVMLLMSLAQEEANRRRRKRKKSGLRKWEIDMVCPEAVVAKLCSSVTIPKIHSFDDQDVKHNKLYQQAIEQIQQSFKLDPPPTSQDAVHPQPLDRIPDASPPTGSEAPTQRQQPQSQSQSQNPQPTAATTTISPASSGEKQQPHEQQQEDPQQDHQPPPPPTTQGVKTHHTGTDPDSIDDGTRGTRQLPPENNDPVSLPQQPPNVVNNNGEQPTPVHSKNTIPLHLAILPQTPEICVICIEPIELAQRVRILPCNHLYHSQCIRLWLKRRNACPCCAEKVIKHRRHSASMKRDRLSPSQATIPNPNPPVPNATPDSANNETVNLESVAISLSAQEDPLGTS